MVSFHQLTTFCTVLSEGSMTAAADKLCLTQPAVSQQIRNLEEEIGVNLLVRGVRKVKPTLQGQLLYDYAKRILQLSQQAEMAIQTIGTELRGHLRMGSVNSIGLHLISPVVGMFLRHNHDLKLKLDYNRGEELIRGMNEGELDAVILPDTEEEYGRQIHGTDKKFLMKDEMWLVATGKDTSIPKHIKMENFFERPIVTFSGEYPRFNLRMREQVVKCNAQFDPVFESSNVGTLKRVIESGLGWGFLPAHCIRKQVRSGRMVRVHVEGFSYASDLNFYYVKNREKQSIIDVFFRALLHQANSSI